MFAEHSLKRGNPWDANPFGSSLHHRSSMDGNTNGNNPGTCSSEAGHFIPIRVLEENLKNQLNDQEMDFDFNDFDPKQQPINRIEIPDCFKQTEDGFRNKVQQQQQQQQQHQQAAAAAAAASARKNNIPPPLVTEHLQRASSPFLDPGHHTPVQSPSYNANNNNANNSNNSSVRHIPITVEGIQKSPPQQQQHQPNEHQMKANNNNAPNNIAPMMTNNNSNNSPANKIHAQTNKNNSSSTTPVPVKILEPIPMPPPPSLANVDPSKPPSPPPRSPKNKNITMNFSPATSPSDELKSTRTFPGASPQTINPNAQAQSPGFANNSPGFASHSPGFANNSPGFASNSPGSFPNSPSFAQFSNNPQPFGNSRAQRFNFPNVQPHGQNGGNSNANANVNSNPQTQNANNQNANQHFANQTVNQNQNSNPPPADECQSAPPPLKKPTPAMNPQLEKVQVVVENVKQLEKQIEEFSGTSKNKEYLFLDEMLTRDLIKLDNIETEGKDDVRNARKACIKLIQNCINRLEAKLAENEKDSKKSKKNNNNNNNKIVPFHHRSEMSLEVNPGEKKDGNISAGVGEDKNAKK